MNRFLLWWLKQRDRLGVLPWMVKRHDNFNRLDPKEVAEVSNEMIQLRDVAMRKPKFIYTMTVVSGDPHKREYPERLRSRCWGYYFDEKSAAYAIEINATDMSERGYYQYAVLSKIPQGPCAIGEEVQWYEFIWDWETEEDGERTFKEAKKIDKPGLYKNTYFVALTGEL